MKKCQVSQKKRAELYRVVGEGFIRARIKMNRLPGYSDDMDRIMFQEGMDTAGEALDVFEGRTP